MCPHPPDSSYVIAARERSRDGDLLVYDVEIATTAGELVERWTGLELRIVGSVASPNEWTPALLAPYLERRVAEIVPSAAVSVAVDLNGHPNGTLKRGDGKPFTNGFHLSRSHAGELTISVMSPAPVGCDCEPVTTRPLEVWRDLLGAGGFALAELVVREGGEPLEAAATRVWCAIEAVKKAGLRHDIGIVLATPQEPRSAASGWVVLEAGAARIATLVSPVAGFADPVAFAILMAGQ
jgi:enediyne polyketide synthase